ncbi:MAG: hypothetical protein ABJ327_15950 [Litoreibacter sp.]
MSNVRDENAVKNLRARFEAAAFSNQIPKDVKVTLEGLFERLSNPVKVSLMGLPGSGKSQVLNLLVGEEIIPRGVSLPTTQLTYGETPRAVCTYNDGTEEVFDRVDAKDIAAQQPIFVTIELPRPALKKISVLEVNASMKEDEQARAINWASKRTDLTLWCTTAYDEREQQLWANAPRSMHDHALMLITHADTLKTAGTLELTIDAVRDLCERQVLQVLSIATLDAISARGPDGTVDKPKLRESGGIALVSSILKQVDQGLQSAADHIDFLFAKHDVSELSAEPEAAPSEPTIAEPASEEPPVAEALATEAAEMETVEAEPVVEQLAEDTMSGAEKAESVEAETVEPETPPDQIVSTEEVIAATEDTTSPELQDAVKQVDAVIAYEAPPHQAEIDASDNQKAKDSFADAAKIYTEASNYLTKQSNEMLSDLSELGKNGPQAIMVRAAENVKWLGDLIDQDLSPEDPNKPQIQDAIMDASDMIHLMANEKNTSATLDTVVLLKQLKNDFEVGATH